MKYLYTFENNSKIIWCPSYHKKIINKGSYPQGRKKICFESISVYFPHDIACSIVTSGSHMKFPGNCRCVVSVIVLGVKFMHLPSEKESTKQGLEDEAKGCSCTQPQCSLPQWLLGGKRYMTHFHLHVPSCGLTCCDALWVLSDLSVQRHLCPTRMQAGRGRAECPSSVLPHWAHLWAL